MSVVAQSVTKERVSVPAEIYRAYDNGYAGNTTVSLRMTWGGQPTMVLEIKPWPDSQYGVGEFFDQSDDCNSTFQAMAVGGDSGWIASSCASNKRESERKYWALQETSGGEHYLLMYKLSNPSDPMDFWNGYYLKLSPSNEFKLRLYMVEKGNEYNVFKQLDMIKAVE